MKGTLFATNGLSMADLYELADLLCIDLHTTLGSTVFVLNVQDVQELIQPKIADCTKDDQEALCWYCWHLFQEAMEFLA